MNLVKTSVTIGIILGSASAASVPAFAASLFEGFDRYKAALVAQHLAGDRSEARRIATELLDEADDASPLRSQVVRTVAELDGVKGDRSEVAYATGRKSEYYCRGKGLVLAEGTHDDGSWSRLVLLSGRREMLGDSYSQMKGDQWDYELSNSYRAPTVSKVWMTHGSERGFNILEVRTLTDGNVDRGSWDNDWDDTGNRSGNHSVRGNAVEPIRLFMAMQYHLWGSWDLGYRLRFEPGYRDHTTFHVSGKTSEKIQIKGARTVAEHLPTLTVKDSTGVERSYGDCYRVDLVITLNGESER